MNKELELFLEGLNELTEQFGIEINGEHGSPYLSQEKDGLFLEHSCLEFNLETKKYEVRLDNNPFKFVD